MAGQAANTGPGVAAFELDDDRPSWERQQQESDDAYKAFQTYLHQEKRRVSELGLTSGYRWSREWSWGRRAYDWDNWMARQDAEDVARARIEMNRRHRKAAAEVLTKAMKRLEDLDLSDVTPAVLIRWIAYATKIERDATGGPNGPQQGIGSPTAPTEPDDPEMTLGEMLTDAGLADVDEDLLAAFLAMEPKL